MCIYIKVPGDVTLLSWGPHSEDHSLEDNPTSLDPFACAGPAQQMAFLAEIITLSLLTELTFSKHPPIYNWNALPEKKTQCLTASH